MFSSIALPLHWLFWWNSHSLCIILPGRLWLQKMQFPGNLIKISLLEWQISLQFRRNFPLFLMYFFIAKADISLQNGWAWKVQTLETLGVRWVTQSKLIRFDPSVNCMVILAISCNYDQKNMLSGCFTRWVTCVSHLGCQLEIDHFQEKEFTF